MYDGAMEQRRIHRFLPGQSTMRVFPIGPAVLLASTLMPGPVCAQSPGVLAFRDSISSVRDMAALRRFVTSRPGDEEATEPFLRRGVAGLRLFELTGIPDDLKHAREAFERAADLDPEMAWARFAIGLTWARDPELTDPPPRIVTGRVFREALGRDARSRASRALREALKLDPGLTEAAVVLADLAVGRRNRDELDAARETLDLAVREGRADARTSLALAEIALAQRDFDAALPAAERAAFSREPPDAARYALARTLLGGGQLEAGAREYFAAIAGATPELARRMYDDIRAVATEAEVAEWEAADPAGRRAWLRNFWEVRAALSGVTVAERVTEHYRRFDRAIDEYPRRRKYGAPPANALLLERPDLPFDDRGIILLRHGEPEEIIRSQARLQNESWAYPALEGGYRLLHFVNYGSPLGSAGAAGDPTVSGIDGGVGQGYSEFVLVYNLLCDSEYLADRALYDRRLLFANCNEFDRRSVSAEVRRDAYAALRTDSHHPDFAKRIPVVYDVFAFRGMLGRTDLTTAFSTPASALQATTVGDQTWWAIRTSLIVADTIERRVTRLDTTLVERRTGGESLDGLVLATLDMPLVPGSRLAQRLVVRDAADSAAGNMLGRAIHVPDFFGDSLMVSDLVLAAPGAEGSFQRGSVSLRLVPTREYSGGAFDVFYEVYNLPAERSYATELVVERQGGGVVRAVKRLFGGGGPEVRLRFEGLAAPESDGVVREIRFVDSELPPGEYRLKITVTDRATRASVTRERPFTVVADSDGGSDE